MLIVNSYLEFTFDIRFLFDLFYCWLIIAFIINDCISLINSDKRTFTVDYWRNELFSL